jgi:uncharacterized protein (DUF2336 family)
MAVPASLIPELEAVIECGSHVRRAELLGQITDLFLAGAERFTDEHVRLFDDVLGRLINEIEGKALSELSRRLAPVGNAPLEVVRRLARDDDVTIAGPVLQQSIQLTQSDLIAIAETKSQAHLLAISGRSEIAEPVTDLLVRRGDREVIRSVARNRDARFSDAGFSVLVDRSEGDGELAETVGSRPDIPPHRFQDLLRRATAVVQQRLLEAAAPDAQAEIKRILAKISDEVAGGAAPCDYTDALGKVDALHKAGRLDEVQLVEFADSGRYEEMVASLVRLCRVPIDVVDRLMTADRPDPILILCRSSGWGWPTAKAIIMARRGRRGESSEALDTAYSNFERLSPATAQRVIRFWQARQAGSS